MATLLLNEDSPKDSIYGSNEKEISLIFTFFFVLLFVQFGRRMILNEPIEPYYVIVMTMLTIVWYGLSLTLSR